MDEDGIVGDPRRPADRVRLTRKTLLPHNATAQRGER